MIEKEDIHASHGYFESGLDSVQFFYAFDR